MRKFIDIMEVYSRETGYVRDNLKHGGEFDYHQYWHYVCDWIVNNDLLEVIGTELGNPKITEEELREEDPEAYLHLSEDERQECKEWVLNFVRRNFPAELPNSEFFSLQRQQLLPRTTWLIHFTEHASDIAQEGFKYGMADIDRLGLTTHFSNTGFSKKLGGYNFAFVADSRYANNAASRGAYGANRGAVMFQNSGALAYHYADEEDQVIFNGADVDPRDIVLLKNSEYDGWGVVSPHLRKGHGSVVFKGDFENVVAWVMKNFTQYRRALTRR